MRRQPRLGGARDASRLLGRHHPERVTEPAVAFRLHLAEDDNLAPPNHEIELVASRPRVRSQNPVAAQPVVPQRTPFRARPDSAGAKRR